MNREMNQGTENRLTPEERQIRIKKLKRKRRFRMAVVTVGFFLLLSIIISPILLFTVFRVKTFTVEGTSPYAKEEIIAASGISEGKSLIFADLDEAAAAIEKTLPYTDNVKLTKKLPDGIVIRFEETYKAFAFQISGGMFALTNSELKVLELSATVPDGVALITGASPVKTYVGEVLSFVEISEDKNEEIKDETFELLLEITQSIAQNGTQDINLIDIADTNNIYLIYQQRIVLKLGDSSELAAKLSLGNRVINEENTIDPSQCGTIDLTIAKKAYFNPSDFDDVEQLVEYSNLYMQSEAEQSPEEENTEGSSEE